MTTFSAEGDKILKKKSYGKWNKGSGDCRTKPHQVKHPTCEREIEYFKQRRKPQII